MVIAYCIVAGITFTIVINAFLKDRDAQADATAWIFMAAATLLWPITLPFIMRRKFQSKRHPQSRAAMQPLKDAPQDSLQDSPQDSPQDSKSPAALPTPQPVPATRDS